MATMFLAGSVSSMPASAAFSHMLRMTAVFEQHWHHSPRRYAAVS
jgi:hypothetical protein